MFYQPSRPPPTRSSVLQNEHCPRETLRSSLPDPDLCSPALTCRHLVWASQAFLFLCVWLISWSTVGFCKSGCHSSYYVGRATGTQQGCSTFAPRAKVGCIWPSASFREPDVESGPLVYFCFLGFRQMSCLSGVDCDYKRV